MIRVEITEEYRQMRTKALGSVNDYFSTLISSISQQEREEICRR